jgi:DMSO reductase family type II enzyme heme b subunit
MSITRHPWQAIVLILVAAALTTRVNAANDAPAAPPAGAIPAENPLRTADEATRRQARDDAYVTFQRSCRPCHGNLGAADGPYAFVFPKRAADLRRPSRDIVGDATRFKRIRDGAAALGERPWESGMPAFGAALDARQIWGLVLLLDDFGKEASGIDVNATGADVYAERCAVCHGAKGAGDGPLTSELLPPPRDLVRGSYRFRSTVSGAAPLDSDIIGVTAHGLGDTAMGHFLALGSQRLEDVTAHVQSLAPTLFATTPPTITGSPMPTEPLMQLAERGRKVYESAKCTECHGATGRGDGPSAATLKDDAGHPSVATNLTKRWLFKAGSSSSDVFRTLASGLNGTPMSSYDKTLSPDERWALATYIERLGRLRPRYLPNIVASAVTEKLPLDPGAPVWKTIPTAFVPLGQQIELQPYWTEPSIDSVDVVAAVNRDELAILLVWDDRSRDVQASDTPASSVSAAIARHGSWHLPDAIAVQLPEKIDAKGTLPPVYLGDATHPVRRWLWSADRQEKGETQALVQHVAGPQATPTASAEREAVQTAATYTDGQWRVVLLTKRPPSSVAALPIALHAWDGGAGESGHWHSFSGWVNVKLR